MTQTEGTMTFADIGFISYATSSFAFLVLMMLTVVSWRRGPVGAWLVAGFDVAGLWQGLLNSFQIYTLNALADSDHAAIILFSLMIDGLIGIITRNGGTRGIVNSITHLASTRRRGQLATMFMGMVVFIDDYANTLVVGNTMRPITDRLRISREKLAYLVDSTAAPVAALALVTTWIGYEVGLIGEALQGIEALDTSPYLLFLNSIAYSFYPWLCIFLLFLVCWTGRDIGPMVEAERRAAKSQKVGRRKLNALSARHALEKTAVAHS